MKPVNDNFDKLVLVGVLVMLCTMTTFFILRGSMATDIQFAEQLVVTALGALINQLTGRTAKPPEQATSQTTVTAGTNPPVVTTSTTSTGPAEQPKETP